MSQITEKNERLIKGNEIISDKRDEDRPDRLSTRSGTVYGSLARKSDGSIAAEEFPNNDIIKYFIGLHDEEDDDSQDDFEYDYYQYDLIPWLKCRKQVIYFSLFLYFIHEHSYLPMNIYRIYLKKNLS